MNSQIESMLEMSEDPLTARVESVHSREASRGKITQFNNDRREAEQFRRNPDKSFALLCWVFALLTAIAAAPTVMFAEEEDHEGGGGQVLPGPAKPKGYSLSDMAKITAFFNSRFDKTPQNVPDTPFQILYVPQNNNLTFEVRPGTMFYVPVFFVDDSPPIAGDFPNVNDRPAVLYYFYAQNEIGNDRVRILVDGMVNSLGADHVVGVGPVKLADIPGGSQNPRTGGYIVPAAFLTPLNKGTHTVEIQGSSDGAALFPFFPPNGVWDFSITYTVIVRDED